MQASQGICINKTYRFCCKSKQAGCATVKSCIIFLPYAEVIFIFSSCERLLFVSVAHKQILKAEVSHAESDSFLERDEFCMKRKIKAGISYYLSENQNTQKKPYLYDCKKK